MTAGMSATNLANVVLNALRGSGSLSANTTPFIQLHTADPASAGTTAVSVGSATRNAATWNAASGGSMTLASLPAWTNGGTTETLTHVSLWSASTVGTFYWSFALSSSQAWVSTNTFTITTFTVSFTPIAA
jgi:hypothetical protein